MITFLLSTDLVKDSESEGGAGEAPVGESLLVYQELAVAGLGGVIHSAATTIQ